MARELKHPCHLFFYEGCYLMSETGKKTAKLSLATKILLAMVIGAALGYIFKSSYEM